MSDNRGPVGSAPTVPLGDGEIRAAVAGAPAIAPGTILAGRYRIERLVASGGMGVVYEAHDAELGMQVALKTIRPDLAWSSELLDRFKREIQLARTVSHPGVCRIFDLGRHGALVFLTMELLDGVTVAAHLRERGPLSPAAAAAILVPVAEALDAAHAAGVVHRDLKPANIILATRGGRTRPVITDFGLARELASPDEHGGELGGVASAAGTGVAGTPGYMSPEQRAGAASGPATDLYALGVMMHELVTGELPEAGSLAAPHVDGSDATVRSGQDATVRSGEDATARDAAAPGPARPRALPGMSPAWRSTVERCLAERPGERFASAADLIAAIRTAVDGRASDGGAAASATFASAGGGDGRKRRAVFGVSAVLACGAAALAVAKIGAGGGSVGNTRAASRGTDTTAPDGAPVEATAAETNPVGRGAFAAGPMTAMGGCVYAPTFLDDETLIFDHTAGDVMDLYRLRAGGKPEQLTSGETWEWRAQPGARAGEVVYVVSDLGNGEKSRLEARDLASGKTTTIATQVSPSVTAAGGAYYYVTNEFARIRRVVDGHDDVRITMPETETAQMLVASHDGTRLAIIGESAATEPRLCLADLATTQVECLALGPILNARPAFSPDDRWIYYVDDDGIRRHPLDPSAGAASLVVPGARAKGGVAIAPGGQLVWSECAARGPLLDLAVSPPRAITDDDRVSTPAAAGDGSLAYVRARRELVVQRDGVVEQLGSSVPVGSMMSGPAFDAAAERVVVTITGDEPGLHAYKTRRFMPPTRLTTGRNDTRPQWLGDTVYFNRWQDELPYVFRVTLDGREPERALAVERVVVGAAQARGELLLASPDETRLYWWNATTGKQRPGPPALAGGLRETYHHALSPDGRWLLLQLGRQGHQLFRRRLDERGAAVGAAEKVWVAPGGATMTDGTIDNDGRVMVAPLEWRGELIAR